MISKGELKEGTKVKYNDTIYKCKEGNVFDSKSGVGLLEYIYEENLNDEVEIIEPDHFTDVGKMATEKIEELNKDSCGVINEYNSQGEVYARAFNVGAFRNEIIDKLNEVIRRINKED